MVQTPPDLRPTKARTPGAGPVSQSTSWRHEVALLPHPVSALSARDFVTGHLIDHDLRYLVHDVQLVASELATNAVEHAREPFTVILRGDDRWVVLCVRDRSRSLPVRVAAHMTDTGGRGLVIVESVSHDWGFELEADGVKSVWASFQVTRERDSRPRYRAPLHS